jgi:hypothetical protein
MVCAIPTQRAGGSSLGAAGAESGQAARVAAHVVPRPRVPLPARAAEADYGDQGVPCDGAPEGRQVCQDQEEQDAGEVQGALQQVPLHARRERHGEGGQAQAVASARYDARAPALRRVPARQSCERARLAARALTPVVSRDALPPRAGLTVKDI